MNKIFEKKVDYANEPEAPMILGMKILKKIEKDWGRDSDVYYEIEDVLIDLGSDSPKRLALALKRELTNYDMWHAPYKGLVNKIEKWVKPTGKVNESRDEEIRKSRFDGLVEKIEYYSYMFDKNGTLSKEQISDLLKVRDTIMVFGTYGAKWASFADEILQDCGCDKYNISKLCQENNGLWESYTPMSDEEYLDKFLNICREYEENKITLYFEDVDSYMIEKRFGDRFKKYLKQHQKDWDGEIEYKAVFHTKNSGYGNRNVCVLYAVEYGGYGYSSTPLCELSFEEFDRLLRNFTFNGGMYRRNDTFMYESMQYDNEEYDEVYNNFYNAIDDFFKDGTLTESDLYRMVKDGVHYDDLKPFITYSLGMMYYYLSEEDEEFYRGILEEAVNVYYYNDLRIEESLNEGISFDNRDRYDAYVLVDGTGAIIHNYEVWKEDWQSVLNVIIGDANYYAKKNKYGTYYVYGCVNNEYDDDTLVYTTDDIDNIYESNKAINRPLFRRPTRLVNTYRDEVFNILDRLLDEGEIGYEELENICYEENIYDELIDYILEETSYGDTDGYRHNVLKLIKSYYDMAYAYHLEDINESEENDEETPKKKNNKTKGRPGKLSGGDYRSEKKEKPKKSGKGKAALAAVAAGGIYTLKKAGDVLVKSFQ